MVGMWRPGGGLRLGDGGEVVEVPVGSRAVFDGSGGLRLVVLPDGVSYDRGLTGEWSGGRVGGDGVVVGRIDAPVASGACRWPTVTVRSGDVIRDRETGEAVAYRGVKVFAGTKWSGGHVRPDG